MHLALKRNRPGRALATLAAAAVTASVLAACGAGETNEGTEGEGGAFGLLINDDNQVVQDELTTLSEGECKAENDTLPLEIETVPQAGLDQKLQLLGGQDALPAQFAAGGAPALTKSLNESGQTLDLEKTLTDLGVMDSIEPAAISTIENLYGDFIVLPYQFNIEGIWYNKQLFEENGIAQPTTWAELVQAAAALQKAGVTAFSASGEQGWPITRLISGYLYRDLGPEALQKVADGEAKLTDPEYVAAAQAVADLGAAGYFGQGVGSIDYDTSVAQFLTGEAGMLYMGSWLLDALNDPAQNKIGVENVGFMPVPVVDGGVGTAEQLPANVGLPIAVSAKAYNDDVGAWLKCISENYGASSLRDQGAVSGFKANSDPGEIPELTKMVQETIATTTESTLWFEALFGVKATTTSSSNVASMVSGDLSAEDFMAKVQADLDAE